MNQENLKKSSPEGNPNGSGADKFIKEMNSHSEKLIEKDNLLAKTYFDKGYAKDRLEQYEVAIKNYDEAIRLNPLYENAFILRSFAKTALGQLEGAINDCDEVLKLNPSNADVIKYQEILRKLLSDKFDELDEPDR